MRGDFDHIEERVVPIGDGQKRVQTFRCSAPGCSEAKDTPITTKRRPPEQLAKMASRCGWTIDLKRGKHLCPTCSDGGKMKPKTEEPKTSSKPREMTRADRRRVFREIDECYDEAGNAYVLDVTDQSIADKLKVPRAWVAQVREESFGPAGPDPAILRIESALKDLQAKQAQVESDAMQLFERATKLGEQAEALAAELKGLRK